jgi:hypothetical protein
MPAWRGLKTVASGVGSLAILAAAGLLPGQSGTGSADPSVAPRENNVYASVQDDATGMRWVLLRGEEDSGGPGRWVRTDNGAESLAGKAPRRERHVARPVIHAGDRLIVEEHTAVAELRLQAVALEPAAAGARLRIRLTAGGRSVAAIALAAGRVQLVEIVSAGWEQP